MKKTSGTAHSKAKMVYNRGKNKNIGENYVFKKAYKPNTIPGKYK